MSVVPFSPKPAPPKAIFVCNCGCASFELASTGEAICRNCQSIAGDDGGWLENLPTSSVLYEGDGVAFSDGGNCSDFAERKAKRDASSADWLIFGSYKGRVQAWCHEFIDTPEREKWLSDGVAAGLKAIMEDKPS